eukprot:1152588-Pelagomonas_calceolata.AAC.1
MACCYSSNKISLFGGQRVLGSCIALELHVRQQRKRSACMPQSSILSLQSKSLARQISLSGIQAFFNTFSMFHQLLTGNGGHRGLAAWAPLHSQRCRCAADLLDWTYFACAGGLPEAGLGICPVCPVAPIEIPTDSEGTPIWAMRQYPKQDIWPWVTAIQQTMQPVVFADLSRRCRQAGHNFLEQGAQLELPGLLSWLESLCD